MNYYSVAATAQWMYEGTRKYGAKGLKRAAAAFNPEDLDVDMQGKVACVTGANSGIGYCVSKSLAERNCTVHMLCRNKARGENARNRVLSSTGNQDVHLHVVDVSDFQQVEEFAEIFLDSNPSLNVLVNNAGGMPAKRMKTAQGHEAIMATMLGGTFLLTKLLMPALEKAAARRGAGTAEGDAPGGGARVINVSSGGMYAVSQEGIPEDMDSRRVVPYDSTVIYAMAKRAQVTLTERWATLHKSVSINSMHPGWCDTPGLSAGMPNFHKAQQGALRSSEGGSDTIVWLACSEDAKGETGKFWFDRKARRTHMRFASTRASEGDVSALWQAAEALCSGHRGEKTLYSDCEETGRALCSEL